MKAPDKIYIQEDKHNTNTYAHPIWYSIDDRGRVEYIRADLVKKELKETVEVAENHAYFAGMIKGQEEFRALVKEMRNAQKQYFKYRTNETLNRSKQLEKKVDEILSGQGKLFE